MKHLILASLLLTACASTKHLTPTENPNPIPIQISEGYDIPIHYTCEQKEINSALVWIKCDFVRDNPAPPAFGYTCIQITYFDELTRKAVATSEKLCSGFVGPYENKTSYIAFQKKERAKLAEKCGTMLQECVMLTEKVSP